MTDTERCALAYFKLQLDNGCEWPEASTRTACKFPIETERLAELYDSDED